MNAREVMRRAPRWALAIGVTWFGVGMTLAWAADEVADAVEPTVRVELADGHGSGFYVGGRYVVTAAHVVRGRTTAKVVMADAGTRLSKIVYYDAVHDLAVLRLLTPAPLALTTASVRCAPVPRGVELEMRGNPYHVAFVSTWGRVSGAPRQVSDKWRVAMPVDANVLPGYSGGPAFTGAGRVAGVIVGVLATGNMFGSTPAGIGYVVPSSVLCEVLTLLGHRVEEVAHQ